MNCRSIFGASLAVAATLACASVPAVAQSASTEICKAELRKYLAARGPKAFAQGRNGCGWRYLPAGSSIAVAKQQAMGTCQRYSQGCRIIAESR